MVKRISHRPADEEATVSHLSERSRALVENKAVSILQPAKSPCEMNQIVVFPNFKCNFSCSYCYAAKGRSNVEMDVETLDAALDWFLDKNRIPDKDLFLFVVGGGEPTMSWGVVEELVKKVTAARKT